MKTMKKNLLILVTGILCVCCIFGFALANVNKVSADETQNEETQTEQFYIYGASVRAPEDEIGAAVKFHILAAEEFYQNNIADNTVNVKVIVADNLGEGETVLTTANTSKVKTFEITCNWSASELLDGYKEAVAYFYGIPENCYDVDLAVAAEIKQGDTVLGSTNQEKASLAWVAWKSNDSYFDAYRPEYKVTYGENTTAAKYGTAFKDLSLADLTKTGYTFGGWSCADEYITKNVTATASWKVAYDLSVENATVTLLNNTMASATAFDAAKEGAATVTPKLSVTPDGKVNYSYVSDNTAVATVSETGVITAAGKGTAKITVTATDEFTGETKTATVDVTVNNYHEISSYTEFIAIENNTTDYYRLTADLDFSSNKDYQSSITFNGVFDGNGKKIAGLKMTGSSTNPEQKGLFYIIAGATIKNLNVIDAELSGTMVGTIAYAATGSDSYFENVYVSVKSVNTYSTAKVGGLVGYTYASLQLKNCCVYLPGDNNFVGSYVCGNKGGWIVADNCVFIGENKQLAGNNNDVKIDIKSTTTIFTALEAHKNKEKLGSFYEAYSANHPYIALSKTNFTADTVKALTSEIVELTEDVDLTGYAGAGDGTFSGVFEGNGHKITGISFSSDKKGIFNIIAGALIKNVKIIDAALNSGTCGTIAYAATTTASTIKNVYVSVKTDTDTWSGGLVGYMYNGLNISNCCVDFINLGSGCSHGYVTGRSNNANNLITLNDCVFIGGKGNLCGRPADSCKCESEYIKVTDTTDKTAMATALAKLEEIGFKSTYEENHSTTND